MNLKHYSQVLSPAKYMLPPKVFNFPFRSYTLYFSSCEFTCPYIYIHNRGQIFFSDNLTPLGVTFILLAMVQRCCVTLFTPWVRMHAKLYQTFVTQVVSSRVTVERCGAIEASLSERLRAFYISIRLLHVTIVAVVIVLKLATVTGYLVWTGPKDVFLNNCP